MSEYPVLDAPAIERALATDDVESRRLAVRAASRLEGDVRAGFLLRGLGDADWRVRREALDRIRDAGPEPALLDGLVSATAQGENVGLRNAAIEALANLGPAATDRLRSALGDESHEATARKFFVEALGEAGARSAVGELVALLGDEDPNVAAAAIDALARIGGDEAERALRARLEARDPFQRMAAIDGLARMDASVPYAELEPVLADRLARRSAIPLLGRSGDARAAEPLLAAIATPSLHSAARAVVALARLQKSLGDEVRLGEAPEPVLARLAELMESGDRRTRQAAAHLALVAQREDALAGVVVLAREDLLPPESVEVLRAWGTEVVSPLLALSSAPGADGATALTLASGLCDPEAPEADRVRDALRAASRDHDPQRRSAAARGLARFARADDAAVLVELASAADEGPALYAAQSLERLADRAPDAVRGVLAGVALQSLAGGAALAAVLARSRGADAFEQLQAGLSSERPTMRRAVIAALGMLADPRAAELVAFALADEDVDVRITAARVLGGLRDESGRPLGADALLLALQSDSPAVQAAAAEALGELGDARALSSLAGLTGHRSVAVVAATLEALAKLGDPELLTRVDEALTHPEPEVVKQALHAASRLEDADARERLSGGLEHAAWHVRILAARLLGSKPGSRELLEAAAAKEEDPMVRGAIEEALEGR